MAEHRCDTSKTQVVRYNTTQIQVTDLTLVEKTSHTLAYNPVVHVRVWWFVETLKITQHALLGNSGRVNSLAFCLASLKSLGCFYFRCVLSSQWKAVTVNLWILHCQFQRHFWRPVVRMHLATSNNLLLVLQDPQNTFFSLSQTRDLLVSKKWRKDTFFHAPSPFPSTFRDTATVVAFVLFVLFVLFHNSMFSFHCYTQHKATPTQKSTSRDFLHKRLQRAFTCANQLHWTAQYTCQAHSVSFSVKNSTINIKMINQS